jgi:hypothetical protein
MRSAGQLGGKVVSQGMPLHGSRGSALHYVSSSNERYMQSVVVKGFGSSQGPSTSAEY